MQRYKDHLVSEGFHTKLRPKSWGSTLNHALSEIKSKIVPNLMMVNINNMYIIRFVFCGASSNKSFEMASPSHHLKPKYSKMASLNWKKN